jgi:hypothetical protein
MSDFYLHGGSGPDTGDPAATKYDYRYTNYDPRTGAEGNPSPIQADADLFDTLRRSITVTPTAYGDSAIRQRFYRRGGTLPTDWFYLGQNTSDGGSLTDTATDTSIEASTTVELDNYQPAPTVNSSGTTVLAQPLYSLWGPLDDILFACGDPYRPGHVYFCKRGNPDSWPDDYNTEVCSPSEHLQAGCLFGGQSFVFSRERLFVLYPNLSDDGVSVTSTVTQCKRGMVSRWAVTVGFGGMYFVSRDGVYKTAGGPEEWLSADIDPIFRGEIANGMMPIDFEQEDQIRLEIHENELYFSYQDCCGDMVVWVFNLPYQFWRSYSFQRDIAAIYSDEGTESTLLFGSASTGQAFTHTGFSDDGLAIPASLRTKIQDFGRPREEKRLGDQVLDLNSNDIDVTVTNYVNDDTLVNPASTVSVAVGRKRPILDAFGTTPQRVRNISTEIAFSYTARPPILYQLATSYLVEPDITLNRATQWDDLGHSDESYLTGVTFDCDTGGVDRTIIVERDYNGVISTAATLTVNTSGRHKVKFSWTAVQAHKVRLRPDDDCLAWQLFKVDWIAVPEPPRISKWDTYFENGWDQYYTGVDLFCDTGGLTKTVEVYVDNVLIKTETVNTNGRLVHHITLPWGRGHVFHLVATDDNPGILFDVRWQLDPEPSEQANWNQNFTISGTEGDKYLKAIVVQCDTYAQNKTVTVEVDGVVVETLSVNANGRKVVQLAFPQHLGRVFRIYPTDGNPGRLYSLWWVFDQEPLALDRWETQEITHGMPAWHYPLYGHIAVKSVSDVMLQVTAYNQTGQATTRTYTLPSTEGAKQKLFVPFQPTKGVLYKYVLTSPDAFWLYREETTIAVRQWGTDATAMVHIFGNDAIDSTRGMTKSELAAARSGGNAS